MEAVEILRPEERKVFLNLTKAQQEAIMHKDGPMLVLAGPGSGKTSVITNRTRALIEEYGINPREILVITFTKAAATEMKERFLKMMGIEQSNVYFGTFHAIFFTILRYAYNFTAANILREEDKLRFFTEMVRRMQLEIEDEKEFVSNIISEVSLVKSERMQVQYYYSMNCSEEAFQNIYNEYENFLRQRNLIDFDDMLLLCYELFVKRPDILKIWQQRFRYILVDEFQDINQVQYDIVRMLAQPEDNLFIVGDDDQSIYRFRGAKPEIMLNFTKDYPNCKQVLLDYNFRSTPNIVKAALNVVKNNTSRFDKKISAVKKGGDPVQVITFKTLEEENLAVVKEIQRLRENGVRLNEIAVLFRTNTGARGIIDKLMEYNIPFRMRDSIPNIFEHWITKNLMAYMKLAMGETDRALYLEIMNRPKRYVNREALSEEQISLTKMMQQYQDKPWMVERLEKLLYDLSMLKKMSPSAAISYIRKAVGYDEYLEDYSKYRRINVEELYDTIEELQESAKAYETYQEWFDHMEEYKLELQEQMENRRRYQVESVSLATMHSAKGLEYEAVFIVDANEGITPHHKAALDEDMEEERRMFYVAMTRAKRWLYIYSAKERYNKEFTRSRFVGEMLFNRQELAPGCKVAHKTYGLGKVQKIEERKITIYFDRLKSCRVLDLDFCVQNGLLEIKE